MDKSIYSKFYFDNYKITNISFQLNNEFKPSGKITLNFDVERNISINDEENKANIELIFILWDKPERENYPFRIEINIVGTFSADDDMDRLQFEKMCKYNGTAILFPYLRSALTDITKISNFGPPVVLPSININNLLKQEEEGKENND